MTTLTTKQIAALVSVSPRSTGSARHALNSIKERALNEARYTQGTDAHAAYYHVGDTAQRIQHATETGRIWGLAISTFREMTPYQVCRLVAGLTGQQWSAFDDEAVAVIRAAIEDGVWKS